MKKETIEIPIFDIDGDEIGTEVLEYEVTDKHSRYNSYDATYSDYYFVDVQKPTLAHPDDIEFHLVEELNGGVKIYYLKD